MADLFITGHWYHYAQLLEHEKKLYMHIYNRLKERCSDFTFPIDRYNGVYPTKDRIGDLLLHVIWDNPAMYYVDATNVTIDYQIRPSGRVRMKYTEYFSPEQHAQIGQILRMRVDEILDSLQGQAEGYPQVYKLYRYMIANIRYMNDISQKNTLKNLEARTITGPLLNHLGVCAGYTKMFKLLCDQIGIGCFYIRGKALGVNGWGNHGWNVVYLDGKFYHVDITFGSTNYQITGKNTCAYFLRGDDMMWKNHRWDRSHFPVMVDDYL